MIGVLASMKNRSCKLSNYDRIGSTVIVLTRNEVLNADFFVLATTTNKNHFEK